MIHRYIQVLLDCHNNLTGVALAFLRSQQQLQVQDDSTDQLERMILKTLTSSLCSGHISVKVNFVACSQVGNACPLSHLDAAVEVTSVSRDWVDTQVVLNLDQGNSCLDKVVFQVYQLDFDKYHIGTPCFLLSYRQVVVVRRDCLDTYDTLCSGGRNSYYLKQVMNIVVFQCRLDNRNNLAFAAQEQQLQVQYDSTDQLERMILKTLTSSLCSGHISVKVNFVACSQVGNACPLSHLDAAVEVTSVSRDWVDTQVVLNLDQGNSCLDKVVFQVYQLDFDKYHIGTPCFLLSYRQVVVVRRDCLDTYDTLCSGGRNSYYLKQVMNIVVFQCRLDNRNNLAFAAQEQQLQVQYDSTDQLERMILKTLTSSRFSCHTSVRVNSVACGQVGNPCPPSYLEAAVEAVSASRDWVDTQVVLNLDQGSSCLDKVVFFRYRLDYRNNLVVVAQDLPSSQKKLQAKYYLVGSPYFLSYLEVVVVVSTDWVNTYAVLRLSYRNSYYLKQARNTMGEAHIVLYLLACHRTFLFSRNDLLDMHIVEYSQTEHYCQIQPLSVIHTEVSLVVWYLAWSHCCFSLHLWTDSPSMDTYYVVYLNSYYNHPHYDNWTKYQLRILHYFQCTFVRTDLVARHQVSDQKISQNLVM